MSINFYVDKFRAPWAVSMGYFHEHNHWEIQFLIKGKRFYFIENVSYRMETPTIIVVPPHAKHTTGGEAFERYNLNIMPDSLTEFQKSVLARFSSQHAQPIEEDKFQHLSTLLEQLRTLPQNGNFKYHAECLLAYLFYLMDTSLPTTPQISIDRKQIPLILYRIIDYINENLQDKLSLESIAKHFNASVSYIRNLFSKYIRQPLYDYILMARLNKSMQLLLKTRLSITKIAEQCGFSSSNYYYFIFKKKQGLSPSMYRKIRKE